MEITDIQAGLVRKLKMKLDEGIEDALSYAEEQIEGMKVQFTELFEDLDDIIQQKYTELEQCAKDQKTKEIELEKNRKLLRWIEACKEEIEEILNIEGKAGRK